MNPSGFGITSQQMTHESCKISPLAVSARLHETFTSCGPDGHKNAAGATATIFVVFFGGFARCCAFKRPDLVQHLIRLLVHANYRLGRIMRFFVLVKDVFHPLTKFFGELGNAPSFFRHGFISCSFSHSATSLLLTDVTKPCLTARSQSSSSVQRVRPSGGSVQAKATTRCCCLGVNVGGAPDRGASYNARSKPSVQNRLRTLRTVRSEQSTCPAISSSVNPSSDFSRIEARRTTRTDRVPDRTNSCKRCRASSLRHTMCSFMPGLIPPEVNSWNRY